MSAPSPVFSRTMSAMVGGLRSVVVSVVLYQTCVLVWGRDGGLSRGRFDRRGRGTTVWLPGMGSPYRVRGRLRLHGNDGGGWLVSLRRTYRRADTWVRPYGWSRAHPPHRIPHPHRTGEGGFQTRPYGSRDRGWVPAPYRVRGRLFGKLRTGSERRGGSYGGTVPARRNPAQGRNDGLLNCVMFNSRRSQNEMTRLVATLASLC